MPLWKSTQDSVNRTAPISASLTGTQITTWLGGGSSWAPSLGGNGLSFCIGASLLTTGTTGLLAVHLLDDPVGVWYKIDLVAGAGIFKCVFDLVGSAANGTTVTLDGKLYIYPGMYKNISNS